MFPSVEQKITVWLRDKVVYIYVCVCASMKMIAGLNINTVRGSSTLGMAVWNDQYMYETTSIR
jgi:hypothetical protein